MNSSLLTKGSKGPLLGHQGEESWFKGICDDDVKQLLKVLPVTGRETTSASVTGPSPDVQRMIPGKHPNTHTVKLSEAEHLVEMKENTEQ